MQSNNRLTIMDYRIHLKIAVAILLPCLLSACRKAKEGTADPRQYPTVVLAPVSRTQETQYPAILKGRQNVEIRPQCSGIITQICIEEGAEISKGQTLFVIDQAPFLAALKTASANVSQAEARLATAHLVLDSKKTLFNENVISEYELQTAANELKIAEATLEQMRAQHDNARTELAYTVVKSPVNGVAGMIPYRVGALVDRNIAEPLACVSDTEEVFAYFSVPESDELTRTARQGNTGITFRPANKALPVAKGSIDAVSGTADSRTGTVRLRARIPNRNRTLYDGSTGTVIVASETTDCLVVPQTATYEIQNRTFVYRVENGKAVSVPVETKDIGNGKEYIVISGLKAGDEIISEGAGLVREGTEITRYTTSKNTTR